PSLEVLGTEASYDRWKNLAGAIRVANRGTVEARGVKLTATFYDAKRKKLWDWTGPLGKGLIEANSEQNVAFMVPNKSGKMSASYELRVGCDNAPEAVLSGSDFTNVED